jgi:DNA-binding LytR/AlgR family response regulator
MKLTCIVVDDEPVARKVMKEYIDDIPFLELKGMAENPVKAMDLLQNNVIDLMFLDINMPRMTGMEFLRSSSQLPITVITTAYAEYAVEGFELNALDYLVKPISFERFLKAANKAKDFYGLKMQDTQISSFDENHFFVKSGGKIEKIYYEELLYVEAMMNYVYLHTASRKLIVYLTVKGIMEQLPASLFIKVHKSFIVNITKIKTIHDNQLNIGAIDIPVSQALYDNVIKAIVKDKMIKR